MTNTVDAIIVGGGIVGCASAYYLSKRGLKVVLYEKGVVAGEQSSRNWGFVRQQGRDPVELPLMIECNRIWQTLERELQVDLGWRQAGNLAIAVDEKRLAAFEGWLPVARQHGLDSRVVSPREIEAIVPGIAKTWAGGLFTASDGQADPELVTAAFAAAARRQGAEILERQAVDRIDTAGGKVVGVETGGVRLRADRVVVAAGAWSSRLLNALGHRLPQALIRATVARTTAVRALTAAGVWSPAVAFRQRRDGTLNISSGHIDYDITLSDALNWKIFYPLFRENRGSASFHIGGPFLRDLFEWARGASDAQAFARTPVLDPPANARQVVHAIEGLHSIFPDLGRATVTRAWAGAIDMTPDAVPVIDELQPGLMVATGLSGHGFGMGPIIGRLIGEWGADGRPSLDLSKFALKRFDGPVSARAVI